MDNITIQAPAKINLFLDVIRKRPDGYHDLKMIMQTINLYDDIHIDKTTHNGIEINCDAMGIPRGENNIAYKAAELMKRQYNIKQGMTITIKKRIPVSAGLAGGSADAAAVMRGINELFGINIDNFSLAKLGKQAGADVPFCIIGETAIAQGVGEVLTPLELFGEVPVVLVKPQFSVSTAYVFNKFIHCSEINKPDINRLIEALRIRDIKNVGLNLFNALETVTAEKYREIKDIKRILNQNGAIGSLMSGSGPSVFGIFDDNSKAQEAYSILKSDFKSTFLLKTC